MERIVVGVDGSPVGAAALRWAVAEAEVHSATLVAVMAWGYLDQHHADPAAPFDPEYGEDDAREALAAYVAAAVGPAADRVELEAVCDLPAPALVAASHEASLLVVGARGLGGFKGLLLGSVSQHCLHHAECPVAVVREGEAPSPEPGGRIVVGVDGSSTARQALHWAVAEARARKAALEVVHTWHMPYVGGYPYSGEAFDPTTFEDAGRRTLATVVAGEDTTGLSAPVEQVLATGSPASAILSAAEGADLVVVGSRGLGGLRGMLLGSVSNQIAHHATCPVVVVPPTG